MAETLCYFNLLPLQTVYEILDLIPFCEKKKARLVCHEWRMMIDSQRSVVFRPVLTDNSSMKYFLQSYRSMDNVFIQNINKRKSKNAFGNSQFPHVKNAELGWKNSQGNIERFLTQGCEFAESLTLVQFSLERISRGAISKTLSEIDWRNLTRLKVVVTASDYNEDTKAMKHMRNVTAVFKYARIPSLQELDYKFLFSHEFSTKHKVQYQKLFLGLYLFLAGHSKTLKMLTGRVSPIIGTLEIPEIPMDLQQSLVSNMKLQHFSLSLWGIRQFDSTLNEALFGTELKILDINIYHLQTNDSHLFDQNLQLLFERNGKTLTNVSLDLPVYRLNLMAECTALETLKLDHISLIVEPEDPRRLSHIKLKSFSSRYMYSQQITPGLFRLLHQSFGTLEHLTLYKTPDTHLDHHPPSQIRLSDFVALKSLKIVKIDKGYVEANMDVQFPRLTELETYLTSTNNVRLIVTWITKSMRNLEMIAILGPYMDVHLLRTLFTLPKLKRIVFSDRERWSYLPRTNAIEEIKEFCEIPGVTLSTVMDGRKIGHFGKMHVIKIYRRTVHNPVSN